MEAHSSYPFKCGLGHYCNELTVVLNPQMSLIDVCYIRTTEFESVNKHLDSSKQRKVALEQQIRQFAQVYTSFETFNVEDTNKKTPFSRHKPKKNISISSDTVSDHTKKQ